MIKSDSGAKVKVSYFFAATPERVFQAWTESEAIEQWLCPFGMSLEVISLDVRPGGRYEMRMQGSAGENNLVTGEYLVVEAPSQLKFTWSARFLRPGADKSGEVENTLITVELESVKGGTKLHLTHERFSNILAADSHDRGWGDCLAKLELVLSRGNS